jgi:ATP synthase subunit 6
MLNMFNFFGPLAQFDEDDIVTGLDVDVLDILVGLNGNDMGIAFGLFLSIAALIEEGLDDYDAKDESDNDIKVGEMTELEDVDLVDEETFLDGIVSDKNLEYDTMIGGTYGTLLLCNVSGMLPFSGTLTAQLIFTLFIALWTMLVIWAHSFEDNKILMFNHFLPSGSPLVITPFIILIELVSTLSRVISLSVRLFANMTAGHALLKILSGFVLVALSLGGAWKVLAAAPLAIVFIITILELIIAVLQAYVFTVLVLIYVSEQE